MFKQPIGFDSAEVMHELAHDIIDWFGLLEMTDDNAQVAAALLPVYWADPVHRLQRWLARQTPRKDGNK